MGQLSGFTYTQVIKKLKKLGCIHMRTGKWSHEIRFCERTYSYSTIPKHPWKDMKEWTLRAILRQLQISPSEFLWK